MNAADMMSSPVVTIGPESTVRDAAWTMLTHRISAIPVLDRLGRLVGVISEGDLLRRAETGTQRRRSRWGMFGLGSETLAAEFVKSHGRKVADVMTRDVITACDDTPAHEIARLMETHGIKRVPIVADGKLVGIVSRADFLTALAGMQPAETPESADDAPLRAAIIARLGAMPWIQPSIVNVAVHGGAAELTGLADSDAQRRAVRIVVETTPGVRTVQDNMRVQPYAVCLRTGLERDLDSRLGTNSARRPPGGGGAGKRQEAAMTMMAHTDESRTVFGRVAEWLKAWWERSTALAELEACGRPEMERVARDAGVGVGDLRVLAGKWPDSADLVERRLAALGVDAGEVEATEPAVMRDLQRVCSVCDNKRVCEHDLDRSPANAVWSEYCPNAGTLEAIAPQAPETPGRKVN